MAVDFITLAHFKSEKFTYNRTANEVELKLPATFGKYELLKQIGSGGMAEIYLARAFGVAGFEKQLVIKRIRPDIAQNPRFIKLFINEAKIGVELNHPNIVQVYDLGRVGPIWYMAMELLNGRDLNKIVKRFRGEQKKLPLKTLVVEEVL